MNTNAGFDRQASAWLADGPTELSDRVLDAALREVHQTRQRRRWSAPWRAFLMSLRLSAAALIAIVAVAGVVAFNMLGTVVGPPILPTPAPTATAVPTGVPFPTLRPIDTSAWVSYESTRYGLTISHPLDWTEDPSDHDWAPETDFETWTSTATESFFHPGAADGLGVKASAWAVRVAPGTTATSWLQGWCAASGTETCAGLPSVVVDVQSGDGHLGVLSQYGDTMAAFLDAETIYVVAIWRVENDPAVLPYGGARRLIEAYLSTLALPAESPLESPAST